MKEVYEGDDEDIEINTDRNRNIINKNDSKSYPKHSELIEPNKDSFNIRARINKYYFNTETKSNVPITRIAYVSYTTLLKRFFQTDRYYVINSLSSSKNRTVVFIKGLPSITEDSTIYIHPIIMQCLNYPNHISINSIESEIPINKQKYSIQGIDTSINNLPLAKTIFIIKIPNNNNPLLSSIQIEEEINSKHIISLNEIISIGNSNNVNYDILTGFFTTKNIKQGVDLYQVIEIEYENYDSLIIMMTGNNSTKQRLKASQNNLLNAYFIGDKGVTTYEIGSFNTNVKDTFLLPKHLFRFMHNQLAYNNDNDNDNQFNDPKNYDSIRKCYSMVYKQIKEAIIIKKVASLSILGSNQSGIANMLMCLSDKIGYMFFKKQLGHYTSGEEMLTYMKEKEFSSPCLVLFSNLDRIKWLNSNDIIRRLKQILSIKREINDNVNALRIKGIIFVFHFQSETSIPPLLSKIIQRQIVLKQLTIENKKTLIHSGMNNYINHSKVILQNNKLLLLNLSTILNTVDFTKLNINSNIEKILMSLSIKDLKAAIKMFFIQILNNQQSQLNYDQILLEVIKTLKQQKLNQDETLINTIPEIRWTDIGGLDNIKEEINDIINLPMKYPHMFNNISLKRKRGLLLYGPPGTGKTLIAKAIANECSMNFISVKGPELLNMYVGESEKNIKAIFDKAKANSPCVIFFDEIDSLCPRKSKNSDQSNIMDRIVSQFLIEIDEGNASNSEPVIVIAATNRPDLLDPSLLRPGRFDKMVYVGLPVTLIEKMKILQVHTNRFQLDTNVDLDTIVNQMPVNYSGADIYQVCSKSFIFALKEYLAKENKPHYNSKASIEINVKVNQEHFLEAINQTAPSISIKDTEKYKLTIEKK